MPNPVRRTPGDLGEPGAALPTSPLAMPEQQPEPKLPLSESASSPLPEGDAALPMEDTAPVRPGANSLRGDNAPNDDLLKKVNELYESATKLQREAEEIRKSIERDKESGGPSESMSRDESNAASDALIGL